jgi:TRAP-type C4-dicarboxylate transport system permease small subunit
MAAPSPERRPGSPLGWLYDLAGVLAACCMVAIAVLVTSSIVARFMGTHVPGLANYAGYCMAGASFLALAHTFGKGEHIRVTLILNRFCGRARRLLELWCLGVGTGLACFLAWYAIKMVRVSILIRDVSQGPDATPLWIPQLAMAIGTTILAIALADRTIRVLTGAPVQTARERVE